MKRTVYLMVFLILILLPAQILAKDSIYVSILPQKYFAEKICGDKFDIKVMVLPGHSPATYSPKPNQMKELANAKIYFSIGVPFEKRWLMKLKKNFRGLKIADSSNGIKKRKMEENIFGGGHHHHHGDDGEHHECKGHHHDHGAYDPHVWMSPVNAIIISRNILSAVSLIDSANKDFYVSNYAEFVNEIAGLEKRLLTKTKGLRDKKVLVFHPSWGYFMDDYKMIQIPVEHQGKEPSPKYLSKLLQLAKRDKIDTLLVQPQFPTSTTEVMKKTLKLDVHVADPLAYEWDDNLIKIADLLSEGK